MNKRFDFSITYLLFYVFIKISVYFRSFFSKIFGKFGVIAMGHHTRFV